MDGNTYEEKDINNWLQDHDTSPKTNLPLESKRLIPNITLRILIQEAVEKKQVNISFNA
jgi:hypothetical protein